MLNLDTEEPLETDSAPEMLQNFVSLLRLSSYFKCKRVIADKLEQMTYIADQRNIRLPENFPKYQEPTYFEDFIACMKCLDARFEEKFHFYVSREQVNYEHLDNFLNIHLLRF
jgi:hypothetical protein